MPDTDLAAAARILTALAEAVRRTGVRTPLDRELRLFARELEQSAAYEPAVVRCDDRAIAAAVLDAARREVTPRPRVFLPGDTVPAGVAVIDEPGAADGGYWVALDQEQLFDRPVVEIHVPDVPDFAAAVAAEQTRRAGGSPRVDEVTR